MTWFPSSAKNSRVQTSRFWGGRSKRQKDKARSNQYELLEPKRCLSGDIGTVVANYQSDFPTVTEGPSSGWSYGWNAPAKWQPFVSHGRGNTGRLDHVDTVYRDLEFAGSSNTLTPDGDLNTGNSHSARALALTRIGGQPGLVDGVKSATLNNSHDRFAIASFTVSKNGVYELDDSFIQSMSKDSDGIEFRVFINRQASILSGKVTEGSRVYFDTELGFLRTGDTIHVAVGGNETHLNDSFRWDYSIIRHDNRLGQYANFRNDISKAPGTNNWSYLWNEPRGWTSSKSGDLATGAIGNTDFYQPLVKRGSAWRIAGSKATTEPGFGLRFDAYGGQPGIGYASNVTVKDRFAIAAFKIGVGGNYVINDSFLSVLDRRSDGVEVIVHVDDNTRLNRDPIVAQFNRTRSFDMNLGELSAGSMVYVAFGAVNNMAFDVFAMDFSIERVFPRELPLRDLRAAASNVYHVRDWGAIANDGKSDWVAINNALNFAKTIDDPVELRFDNGIYNLSPTTALAGKNAYFTLNHIDNLTINGNSAQFIVDDYQKGLFIFQRSENVIVKNLTVDFATQTTKGFRPTTFTQGIIENVNPDDRSIVLRVDTSRFLAPNSTFVTNQNDVRGWGYAIDPAVAGRVKFNADIGYGTLGVSKVDGDSFRLRVHQVDGLEVGDRYVMHRRINTALIGAYSQSRQVSVIGVTAFSTPSVFVASNNSEAVNVINSRVMIRPGSGRWKSANADGVHIQSNRIGPWVENSFFDGLSDDVMNFYTLPSTVLKQHSTKSFTLAGVVIDKLVPLQVDSFHVGDELTFLNPLAGNVINKVKITSVRQTTSRADNSSEMLQTVFVTVDQPVAGIVEGRAPKGDVHAYRAETTVSNSDVSKSFLVQGNTMSNSRRYGNFIMASRGEVTNNRYIGLSDQAINGANETGWPLGLHISDVTIRENLFIANGFSRDYLSSPFVRATIDLRMDRYRDLIVSRNDFQLSNIKIIDNEIRAWLGAAISIRNTDQAVVANNKIYAPRPNSRGAVAVHVDWNKGTRLVRNQTFGGSVLYGNRVNNIGLRYV